MRRKMLYEEIDLDAATATFIQARVDAMAGDWKKLRARNSSYDARVERWELAAATTTVLGRNLLVGVLMEQVV